MVLSRIVDDFPWHFFRFPNFYSEHLSLTSVYNEEVFCVCFFKRKVLRSRKSRQREIPLRREKKEDSVTKPGMEMLEKSS